MSRHHITTAIPVACAAFTLSFSVAFAQPLPGGPQQGSGPAAKTPDGVAEQAPKKLGALPSTPVLPPVKDSSRQLRVFSLDGYFRFRTDWMKQFDLGFRDDADVGGAPFPDPLACRAGNNGCKDSFGSANMRLRLEPIIHLDERSSVHMQIDVLDNLVLGSTNDGYRADGAGDLPLGSLAGNQAPPQAGTNSLGDSIIVKRAWAEIHAAIGVLKVGRQPWHWGMGMVANGGGPDPIHDRYNLDAEFGDTVDRLMFSTAIPGTNLINASFGIDWAQTGATSQQTGEQVVPGRQSWDLDDSDDLDQWLVTVSRMDNPTKIADVIADGGSVLNYGAFLAYRTQNFEQRGVTFGQSPDPSDYTERGLKVYVPDLWLHFTNGNFDVEAEAVAIFGSVRDAEESQDEIDIRQFGGVARMQFHLMDGDLTLGIEAGFASGDQYDNPVAGRTRVDDSVGLGAGDTSLDRFVFDRDYHVDLILFRELLGAVSNAAYAKPNLNYNFTSKINARAASIVSVAHRPIATPGNSSFYGLEFDADLGYQNNGFFAGISYGVLFPFAALDHRGETAFGFGDNVGNAGTAQTIQTRLTLQF